MSVHIFTLLARSFTSTAPQRFFFPLLHFGVQWVGILTQGSNSGRVSLHTNPYFTCSPVELSNAPDSSSRHVTLLARFYILFLLARLTRVRRTSRFDRPSLDRLFPSGCPSSSQMRFISLCNENRILKHFYDISLVVIIFALRR